jgi:hypothetical protein
MSFIPFPVLFTNDDEIEVERKETLGIESEAQEGTIYLNTALMASYCEMANGFTAVWMAGGECYTLLIKFKSFVKILGEIETVEKLPKIYKS